MYVASFLEVSFFANSPSIVYSQNKCGQFTNTLFVRYHPSLETGGDYSKTLVCRYGSSFNVN